MEAEETVFPSPFAQGSVASRHQYLGDGGLVSVNQGAIIDSYATSSVTGPYSGGAAGGGTDLGERWDGRHLLFHRRGIRVRLSGRAHRAGQ